MGFYFAEEAKVTHMDLDWIVDFSSQKLRGSVTLTVDRVDPGATHLVSLHHINIVGLCCINS